METITLDAALAALTSDTTMASGNSVPFSVSESSAKKISLANLASVVGEQGQYLNTPDDLQNIAPRGVEVHVYNTGTLPSNTPTGSAARGGCIVVGQGSSPKLLIWIDQNRNMWMQASWYGAYSAWTKLI